MNPLGEQPTMLSPKLWYFTEDPDQCRANAFYGWYSAVYKKTDLDFSPSAGSAKHKTPFPTDWPIASLIIKKGPLPDLMLVHGQEFFASRALVDALAISPSMAQMRPVHVFSEVEGVVSKGYVHVRLLASAMCLDYERSESRQIHFTNVNTGEAQEANEVKTFILDQDAVAPADLFLAEEGVRPMIATEALAARIEAAGLTGVAFLSSMPFSDTSSPPYRRGSDGCIVSVIERPLGPRPVRAATERSAFLPDPNLPPPLRCIETAVEHRLPDEYVAFLLDTEFVSQVENAKFVDVLVDPKAVARTNLQLREDPSVEWLAGSDWQFGWPQDWLVIGDDACGNYTFIDLGCDTSPVMRYLSCHAIRSWICGHTSCRRHDYAIRPR